MSKRFSFLAPLLLLLGGCGQGTIPELIKPANRVPAVEINANFLNLPAPTPTPIKKKEKKRNKVQKALLPTLTLAVLKGKVVVLDFWATWCGPCRMEIPSLVRMQNQYGPKGLEVVGLSVEANDNKPRSYFDEFIGTNQINYPIGLATMDTMQNYGISPIPTTFFIDKSGRVALSFVGVHPEEDFAYAIERLLAE